MFLKNYSIFINIFRIVKRYIKLSQKMTYQLQMMILYTCMYNNDIKYRLFEDSKSYYLDSQIKDDFQCNQDCYSQHRDPTNDDHPNICTHDYHHVMQNIQALTDNTQQNNLHSMEERASSFTDDTDTHCDYSILAHTSDTENVKETHTDFMPKYPTIHSQRKYVYRDTFDRIHD